MRFLLIIIGIYFVNSIAEYVKKKKNSESVEKFDFLLEDEEPVHIDDEILNYEDDIVIESDSGFDIQSTPDIAINNEFEEIEVIESSVPTVAQSVISIKSKGNLSKKQLKELIIYKEIFDKPKALK